LFWFYPEFPPDPPLTVNNNFLFQAFWIEEKIVILKKLKIKSI